MENNIPKNEYFAQQFEEKLDNIGKIFKNEKNTVFVVGRIYEFREVEKNGSVSFKLNYYKDQFIKVYISEDKWNEIKKFKAVAENKIVKVGGYLQFWKSTREGILKLNAFKVFKEDIDFPNDIKFKEKLEQITADINEKIKDAEKKIKLCGRVYELKQTKDNGLRFMLNYYRDRSITVYVPGKIVEKIKRFIDIEENKTVKVEGCLNIYGAKEIVLGFVAYGVYQNPSEEINTKAVSDKPEEEIKAIKLDFKIALISNDNGDGKIDFVTKLKDARLNGRIVDDIVVPLTGDRALQSIPEAIKKANANPEVNLICIVRGGGDRAAIDYVFNDAKICESIRNSQKAVLVAVGHTANITNADLVSDAPLCRNGKRFYFKTPSELAEFLVRDVHGLYIYKMKKRSDEIAKAEREKEVINASKASTQVNNVKMQPVVHAVDNSQADKVIVESKSVEAGKDNATSGFNYMYVLGGIVIVLLCYIAFLK